MSGLIDSETHLRSHQERRRSSSMNRLSPTPQHSLSSSDDTLPLLRPDRLDESRRFSKDSTAYMAFLTISMLGLQMVWSVETSQVTPFLRSLGLSKKTIAWIWIAGPISGIVVQPWIGAKSDRCTSKLGRRGFYMVTGWLVTCLCLICLPRSARQMSVLFGFVSGSDRLIHNVTIAWAILLIYALDFAINTVQAAIRAFIVDNALTNQQERANAWASRMAAVGNILGFAFVADEFSHVSTITLFIFTVTIAAPFLIIREHEYAGTSTDPENSGLLSFVGNLLRFIGRLPRQIKAVCYVQLAAWVGWFPILFYSSQYIAEIYVSPIFAANPNMSDDEIDKVWEQGTEAGTRALFVFACTSFLASIMLPLLVAHSETTDDEQIENGQTSHAAETASTSQQSTAAGSQIPSPKPQSFSNGNAEDSPPSDLSTAVRTAQSRSLPSLKTAWQISLLVFGLLSLSTLLVHNTLGASIVIAAVGIPWAMTLWAPFALIAAEIAHLNEHHQPNASNDSQSESHDDRRAENPPQPGIVLGIHNVAVAAPQIISTLASIPIFKALEKPRGSVGDDSVAWFIRFGGIFALVAAWLVGRVREGK